MGDCKGTNFDKMQGLSVTDAEVKCAYILYERLLIHADTLLWEYFMSLYYALVVQAKIRISLGQHYILAGKVHFSHLIQRKAHLYLTTSKELSRSRSSVVKRYSYAIGDFYKIYFE